MTIQFRRSIWKVKLTAAQIQCFNITASRRPARFTVSFTPGNAVECRKFTTFLTLTEFLTQNYPLGISEPNAKQTKEIEAHRPRDEVVQGPHVIPGRVGKIHLR